MATSKRSAKKRSTDAYFLDANVIMYAAGGPHPLREPCRAALDEAIARRASLVSSSEVLQELLYRYFSIRRPELAGTIHRATIDLCDEILPVTKTHTSRTLELLLRYPHLSPRDAIHVATMEGRGLRRILSTDTDFDEVKEVTRIDPTEF